ncbi:MAG: glycosyltransferase family 4 protein [Prevotellamassilia sp.]|nr:glycosyltransferase family 4 protein [Prevotellamassilia sp.]
MTKKHLLFSGNNAWGMYNFRHELLRHFVEKGYRVSVSAPYDEEQFRMLRELGCEVYPIRMRPRGTNPLHDFSLFLQYYWLMRKLKPDMSITYTIKPNIYASWAAHLHKIPFLPVTTGLGYVFLKKTPATSLAKRLYKHAFSKAERVWFLNSDDLRLFREARLVSNALVEQLPGEGVNLDFFAETPMPPADQPITFLYVGRILRDKGLEEFIYAARWLRKRYPQVRVQMLGAMWPENPAAIPQRQMEAWQREGVVEYLGFKHDVRPYLQAAHCVVLPSYREGIPCSLMEGAAMCRILVATDVPGCRDVVLDEQNGYLCRPRHWKSLAHAMERVIKLSPKEREAMGRCGREWMLERFDLHLVIKRYEQMINDTLAKRQAHHKH